MNLVEWEVDVGIFGLHGLRWPSYCSAMPLAASSTIHYLGNAIPRDKYRRSTMGNHLLSGQFFRPFELFLWEWKAVNNLFLIVI